jgi:hypothetical protein
VRECLSLAVWTSTFVTSQMRWGEHVLVAVDRTSMVARKN